MPYAPDLAGSAIEQRYELHELIGEGTFGRVYRGYDRRLARQVAIKVIKPWWAEDPHWAESFEREAQLLARVSDPGIVQIFDVGQAEQGLYYVAELVDGESLARRLRRGPLAPARAAEVAEQLCRALGHAHAEHVVHRDIKPANVLISRRGHVKVADLGVALLVEERSDSPATVVGTPKYMAPEQARGLPATPATDIYSVGVVLYEMLAGAPPFSGANAVEFALRHLQEEPPPLPSSTPHELGRIVTRALAKQPAARYPSANAMAAALAAARARLGAKAPDRPTLSNRFEHEEPPTVADPTIRRFRAEREVPSPERRRVLGAFGLLCAAVLVAGLVFALTARGQARLGRLTGMSRRAAATRVKHLQLKPVFKTRYSNAPRGKVIAQAPAPGSELAIGSSVQIVLSRGPRPVDVPDLRGESANAAQSALKRLGVASNMIYIPGDGAAAGTVVRQSASPGSSVAVGANLTLAVAESPRWRAVTSLSGAYGSRAITFHISGSRWRLVYDMNYVGTCTWLVFCSGPSATVTRLGYDTSFSLGSGDGQTRVFETGPGEYELDVTPGSDTARWSVELEDYS